MRISYKDFRFLLFFLPIFSLKLLNITADNILLLAVSIICFGVAIVGLIGDKIDIRKIVMFVILLGYTGVLVLTCGKQGAFFSVVMMFLLYDITYRRIIYKISLIIGIVAVLLSCYIEREGTLTIRYIGGEWTTIFKRSNILYISYVAIVCVWLLLKEKKKLKIIELVGLSVFSYGTFKYTGSRTGFLTMLILIILLFIFRFRFIQKSKVFKFFCAIAPAIGMFISYITSFLYGKVSGVYVLDNMMQGRLKQGNKYINRYDLKLFGQKIYENTSPDDFWNLDCAYLDMLICYGVIFAVIWVVFSCVVIKFLYEQKRYTEVSIVIMYAVYGISETFLPNGFLNVSIFLYAECLYYLLDCKNRKGQLKDANKNFGNVFATIS